MRRSDPERRRGNRSAHVGTGAAAGEHETPSPDRNAELSLEAHLFSRPPASTIEQIQDHPGGVSFSSLLTDDSYLYSSSDLQASPRQLREDSQQTSHNTTMMKPPPPSLQDSTSTMHIPTYPSMQRAKTKHDPEK